VATSLLNNLVSSYSDDTASGELALMEWMDDINEIQNTSPVIPELISNNTVQQGSFLDGLNAINITKRGGFYSPQDYERELQSGTGHQIETHGSSYLENFLDYHTSSQELLENYPDSLTRSKLIPKEQRLPVGKKTIKYKIKNPESREDFENRVSDLNNTGLVWGGIIKPGGQGKSRNLNIRFSNILDNAVVNPTSEDAKTIDYSGADSEGRTYSEGSFYYGDILNDDGNDSGFQIVVDTNFREGNQLLLGGGHRNTKVIEQIYSDMDKRISSEGDGAFSFKPSRYDGQDYYTVREKKTGDRYYIPRNEVGLFLNNIGISSEGNN
jgi:hypothetical protein